MKKTKIRYATVEDVEFAIDRTKNELERTLAQCPPLEKEVNALKNAIDDYKHKQKPTEAEEQQYALDFNRHKTVKAELKKLVLKQRKLKHQLPKLKDLIGQIRTIPMPILPDGSVA